MGKNVRYKWKKLYEEVRVKKRVKEKRCIFHIPNYIDPNSKSGSSLRPKKMIQGFKENGYIVDCVMGYGKERKIQIEHIKDNIRKGVKYEFFIR